MYHDAVHGLAERVLASIRKQELLRAGDRVGVAVSGGADSVGLLRLLLEMRAELGVVLSVVHFNHKLRGMESEEDENFVADLARQHDLEFFRSSADVAAFAASERVSTETAARELRYEFFRQLVGKGGHAALAKVATAHTLDDQAETVLMRLIRGTGLRGLGGIYPRVEVEGPNEEVCGEIVRPLTGVRRAELEEYLRAIGQDWREDSSNRELQHTRNRVRQLLMPLLEREFNPAIAGSLAEFAEIARGEEDFWENEIAGWMGTGVQWVEPEWAKKTSLVQIGAASPQAEESSERVALNALVDARWFHSEPVAVQRRVLKAIGDIAGVPLEFKHIEEMRRFAEESAPGRHLELPLGWRFEKDEESLGFAQPAPNAEPRDYEYRLPVPGRVRVEEAGMTIVAERVEAAGGGSEDLLDAAKLSKELVVRNWRAGDRYWPAHTKAPKKVKDLLQDRNITGAEKKRWPVVVSGEEIVWVPGFAVAAGWKKKSAGEGVAMREEVAGDCGG